MLPAGVLDKTHSMHQVSSTCFGLFSLIIRSTWLYLQYLVVFTQVAAGWCSGWYSSKTQSQLYVFRANFSPIIRSTWLYLQYLVVFIQVVAHVQPTWNNKLTYIVHLVGYFHSYITMHGFMNVKFTWNTCWTYKTLLIISLMTAPWCRNM